MKSSPPSPPSPSESPAAPGAPAAPGDEASPLPPAAIGLTLEQVQGLFAGLSDALVILDGSWRQVYVNPRAAELYQKPAAALSGQLLWDCFPSLLGTEFESRSRAAMQTRTAQSFEMYHPQLGRWLAHRIQPAGSGVILFSSDITERKHQEEALRESEQRLRQIADAMPQVTWTAAPDGRYTFVNRRWEELTGLDLESTNDPAKLAAVIHPADAQRVCALWAESLKTGEPHETQWRYRGRADGKYRWVLTRAIPIHGSDGSISEWLGTATDIDDQKRDAEALARSERFLQLALSAARMIAWSWDPQTDTVLTTQGSREILGAPPAQMLESGFMLLHPDDREPHRKRMQHSIATGTPYQAEFRIIRPDNGHVVWMHEQGIPLMDDAGSLQSMLGVLVDISERKQAEERLETVLSSINDHLVCYDRDWRYAYVNDKAAKVLGKTKEELLGACIWELFPDAVGNQYYEEVHKARDEHRIVRSEHYYAPFDTWFENHIYPSEDGITVFSADITWRKKIEAELKKSHEQTSQLGAMLEATPDFVTIAKMDGSLQYINPAGRKMVGLAADADPATRNLAQLCPEWMAERTHSEWLPAALRDGTATGEGALLTADRREQPVSFVLIVHKSESGEPELISTIARDLSERKQMEQTLRQNAEHLAEVDRRKDEFLAMLAHELRNPLGPIRNATHLLRRLGSADDTQNRLHDMIERQTTHMGRIVDDLLDVSRITRGKILLRREELEICDLIRKTTQDYQQQFNQKKIALTVEVPLEPLFINGDVTRIAQSLGNLLHNAQKFTYPGGATAVRVHREGSWGVITVSDTGIGMDARTMSRLFEPFAQADQSLERSSGGLGLGLSLVKGLIGLHGGDVQAYSDGINKGARFVMRVPLINVAKEPDRPVLPKPVGTKSRILIIEDNPDAAESLQLLLGVAGHTAHATANAPQALAMLETFTPDIIICDIGLPGMSGYELARRLRADARFNQTFLVALTGYGQEEDQRLARGSGFDVHLTKPVDPDVLESLLSRRTR